MECTMYATFAYPLLIAIYIRSIISDHLVVWQGIFTKYIHVGASNINRLGKSCIKQYLSVDTVHLYIEIFTQPLQPHKKE